MDQNLIAAAQAAKEKANRTNVVNMTGWEFNTELPNPIPKENEASMENEKPIILGTKPTVNIQKDAPEDTSEEKESVLEFNDLVSNDLEIGSAQVTNLTEEELRASMPEVSQEHFDQIKDNIIIQMSQYKKNLIIEYGMTPMEAEEAAVNRMKKDAVKLQKEWLEKHPTIVSVQIDKSGKDIKDIFFTDEEKEKITVSKVIRLQEIEDIALSAVKIIPADKKMRNDLIRRLHGSICQDSVPLYRLCDYVTFSGGQIVELYSIISLEDETTYEKLLRKASFVYEHLIGGAHYKKFNEEGEIILTYKEFLATFPWAELNMALFSILCATVAEESESAFSCVRCHKRIDKKYNTRDLLTFNNCPDEVKEAIDKIIQHRNDGDYLRKMQHPLLYHAKRFRSPITKNIYELQIPMLGKALTYSHFYTEGDMENDAAKLSTQFGLVLHLNKILIYNEEQDGYIQYTDRMDANDDETVTNEELQEFWDIAGKIPQEDIPIINAFLDDPIQGYNPTFEMDIDCTNPGCEYHMHNSFTIDQLLFRKAQDSPERIEVSKN